MINCSNEIPDAPYYLSEEFSDDNCSGNVVLEVYYTLDECFDMDNTSSYESIEYLVNEETDNLMERAYNASGCEGNYTASIEVEDGCDEDEDIEGEWVEEDDDDTTEETDDDTIEEDDEDDDGTSTAMIVVVM